MIIFEKHLYQICLSYSIHQEIHLDLISYCTNLIYYYIYNYTVYVSNSEHKNHISGLNSISSLLHNLGFKIIRDCQKYTLEILACSMALDKPKHSIIISVTKD